MSGRSVATERTTTSNVGATTARSSRRAGSSGWTCVAPAIIGIWSRTGSWRLRITRRASRLSGPSVARERAHAAAHPSLCSAWVLWSRSTFAGESRKWYPATSYPTVSDVRGAWTPFKVNRPVILVAWCGQQRLISTSAARLTSVIPTPWTLRGSKAEVRDTGDAGNRCRTRSVRDGRSRKRRARLSRGSPLRATAGGPTAARRTGASSRAGRRLALGRRRGLWLPRNPYPHGRPPVDGGCGHTGTTDMWSQPAVLDSPSRDHARGCMSGPACSRPK